MNPLLEDWIEKQVRRRHIETRMFSNFISNRFDAQLDGDPTIRVQLDDIAGMHESGILTEAEARQYIIPILKNASNRYPMAGLLLEMIDGLRG